MRICKDFQELAQKVFNEEYSNGTPASIILGKLELLLEKHGYIKTLINFLKLYSF